MCEKHESHMGIGSNVTTLLRLEHIARNFIDRYAIFSATTLFCDFIYDIVEIIGIADHLARDVRRNK